MSDMLAWAMAWLAFAAVAVVAQMWGARPSSGILLLWVLNLFIINGFPGLLFALPGDWSPPLALVQGGLEVATIAMAALAGGVLTSLALIGGEGTTSGTGVPSATVGGRLILWGVGAYAILFTFGQVPSVTAVVSGGAMCLPLGIAIRIDSDLKAGRASVIGWVGLLALAPLATATTLGFMGAGAVAALAVGCILVGILRRRTQVLLFAPIVGYGALSLFVTYQRDRTEIRSVVWGGGRAGERVEKVWETMKDFELFDPTKREHRYRVDERLNQLSYVGLVRENLELGLVELAHGETLADALVALIPRALWREKPIRGGSGNVVATYTGLAFAEGTSVGATQVFEAYINFGRAGVIGVFFALGFLVSVADRRAGEAIRASDGKRLALWALPSLPVVGAGGSFVELSAGAAGGVVAAVLFVRFSRQEGPGPQESSELNTLAGMSTGAGSPGTLHVESER